MTNQYAFCAVSIAPLRAESSDSSEMVSQLLFGETVAVIEVKNQWRKVKSESDQYIGWTDEKCIAIISENQKDVWEQEREQLYNSTINLNCLEGTILLTRGAYIGNHTSFSIGENNYTRDQELSMQPTDISVLSKAYLNAPYLWGGKTLFGIDCSGFTQSVYRFFSINLYRDASMQVEQGTVIPYADKAEGDLAFFKNENGKIHHVGIVLSDNKIIHAHGYVRIDDLDNIGIKHRNNKTYSHKLELIKRLK